MRFMLARSAKFSRPPGRRRYGTRVFGILRLVHLMGTARMGNDPKTSVVDKFNRAHDVKNLFVVDGSSFRDVRPAATDADHSGARLPLRRFHDSGGEEERNLAGANMKLALLK